MLVFQRRAGESVMIGDDVVVEVRAVDRNRVVLGISAPKDIRVDRQEVAERKRLEKASKV